MTDRSRRARSSSRRAARPRLAATFAGVLALAVLAGCQHRARVAGDDLESLRFAAGADSLGLAEFLELPADERADRVDEAARWAARLASPAGLATELQTLRTTVGLDPTRADAWLWLAERTRWFGDYQQTEDALAGCRAALPYLSDRRQPVAVGAAICEAWLRYDRGEWKRGLAWTDSADAWGGDQDEVQLLRALHLAGLGRNRRAEDIAFRFAQRDHRAHWIYAVSFWRRGGPQSAHGIFTGAGGAASYGTEDFVKGGMRMATVRASECYRDFGAVEEVLENWWLAERQYEFAAAFVPNLDRTVVKRVDGPVLSGRDSDEALPVWLAFDRYYVTGSVSAYTALAFARFQQAETPAQREFWASATVDAAGTCVRLDIDAAWARRDRGLVLAEAPDQLAQARLDLETALRWFDLQRRDDVATLRALGHLYLVAERPARARPVLERASRLAPADPTIWSDLGLAHIHLGEPELAMASLARALRLDPTLAVAWYNRGLLRFHLEDLPGAVADLEQARALAPQNREIATLLEEVRRRLAR
ncbi:MAG TPA: tetratricopeptide repeat protein [Candidatus Krumholzibacteria bacterium]|nr:tetratricopeptide repeat protein [Candidatus Krumholzibacteria bacterium]HPD71924.1 tetratricopeptide repeat protein [Candidatus Krumholzibacteria bacterium]HRY41143.1 tetratricopeptide repeat protein [Candidatus Krumholzibacteria bacterium]